MVESDGMDGVITRRVQQLERPHRMANVESSNPRVPLRGHRRTGQRAHTERRLLVPRGGRALISVRDSREDTKRDPRPSKPMIAVSHPPRAPSPSRHTTYQHLTPGRLKIVKHRRSVAIPAGERADRPIEAERARPSRRPAASTGSGRIRSSSTRDGGPSCLARSPRRTQRRHCNQNQTKDRRWP